MGKQRKTKTDESQVAVLEIASRGSWEGCRLCWGPGCAAGRDEMRADERGRRTAEGIMGWKLGTGESRGLGKEGSQELGGHWESREETWNETRGKENDQKNEEIINWVFLVNGRKNFFQSKLLVVTTLELRTFLPRLLVLASLCRQS